MGDGVNLEENHLVVLGLRNPASYAGYGYVGLRKVRNHLWEDDPDRPNE